MGFHFGSIIALVAISLNFWKKVYLRLTHRKFYLEALTINQWDTEMKSSVAGKRLSYRILLRKEPEGGYTVIVPSLPGCVTYGDSIDEAINMAKEAIELYIESLEEHDEEIPTEDGILEYTLNVEANV